MLASWASPAYHSGMKRPIIGLTTGLANAKWSVWDTEAMLVDSLYPRAINRAGGLPILLPPTDGDAEHVIDRIDGLCLIGGPDINPEFYGAQPHAETSPAPKELDAWGLALIRAAAKKKVPFLAICRGLQLLNVAHGGTLHQHLPDVVGHHDHRPTIGKKTKHTIQVARGSILESIIGSQFDVVTYHHQAPDRIGKGLKPIAWTDDGIVEGLHLEDHPWGVGVHWHPEEEDDSPLIKVFIQNVAALSPTRS